MRLFHRTALRDALLIIANGFSEEAGAAILVSDGPPSADARVTGDCLLSIEIPDTGVAELEQYEQAGTTRTRRSFLVPPRVLNQHGEVTIAMAMWPDGWLE